MKNNDQSSKSAQSADLKKPSSLDYSKIDETNKLLYEILQEIKAANTISASLLQRINSGIPVEGPVLVEVDGIVSVVGN